MISSPTEPSPGLPARGAGPFAAAPVWSLLFVAAGGVVAVEWVPAEVSYSGTALWPAALAQTVGLLGGALVAALRSPPSLFRTEYVLSFGLFYWLLLDLMLGQGGVGQASPAAVVTSFHAITLFAIGLWAGSLFISLFARRSEVPIRPQHQDLGSRFLFGAAIVAAVLGSARVVVGCQLSPGCIVEAFYQPRFSAVWFQVDTFGDLDTLFLYSRYFGFLPLPLTVALVMKERRLSWRAILALLLGLACLVFMIGDGGRKDVGTVVGASVLVWAVMQRRVSAGQLASLAAVAGLLVLVMQFMLIARNVGVAAALEAPSTAALSRRAPVGTVDRNFRYLANIVELVPEQLPHNGWQGVAYAATLWVPGGLVPREWQRRSIDLPREMGFRYGPGYTWTCSAIGDLYLIGGLAAVLVGGVLFGVLARAVSGLLMGVAGARLPLLYALLTMTLFLSLRALHELFVTGFAVAALLSFLAVRAVLLRRTA